MTPTMTRASSHEAVVGDPRLEFVEDDDVAFALTLSGEINRIYGQYLRGDLTPAEDVGRALRLTSHALTLLRGSVTKGMPAMRIEVAGAQAQEILAVLFADTVAAPESVISQRGSEPLRLLAPSLADASEGAAAGGPALPPGEAVGPPFVTAPTGPPESPGVASDRVGGVTAVADRLRVVAGFVERRSFFVRLFLNLICYCVVGALIDVPIAVVALFPAEFVPLTAGFLGVPLAFWVFRRLAARLRPNANARR